MIDLKGYQSFERVVTCPEVVSSLQEKSNLLGLKPSELKGRILENFHPQMGDTLQEVEILEFLGVTSNEWGWILNETKGEWSHLALTTISDGVYWGLDVLRLGETLIQRGWITPCSPMLVRMLLECVAAYAAPVALAPVVRLKPTVMQPSTTDLPVNYDGMYRKYGKYIAEQVRRVSSVRTEQELREVTQHVWLQLMEAKILERFKETAETILPSTLTLHESLEFLGLTEAQWRNAKHEGQWVPSPISGAGETALYMTSDIQTLDASGFLKHERGERKHPVVTGRGFKSYLTRAIRNHFYNLLRTRHRRHKERPIDSATGSIRMNSTGSCSKIKTDEASTSSWEEGITDEWSSDLPMESMVDLILSLRTYDLDPTRSEDFMILDTFTRGNATLKSAMRKHGKTLPPVRVVA